MANNKIKNYTKLAEINGPIMQADRQNSKHRKVPYSNYIKVLFLLIFRKLLRA